MIWPGRSYSYRTTLADPFVNLDTSFPKLPPDAPSDASFPAGGKGYALIAGASPLVIRFRRNIAGCVATDRVAEGETFDVSDVFLLSKCVGGAFMKPIDLQSNELLLTKSPAQR